MVYRYVCSFVMMIALAPVCHADPFEGCQVFDDDHSCGGTVIWQICEVLEPDCGMLTRVTTNTYTLPRPAHLGEAGRFNPSQTSGLDVVCEEAKSCDQQVDEGEVTCVDGGISPYVYINAWTDQGACTGDGGYPG